MVILFRGKSTSFRTAYTKLGSGLDSDLDSEPWQVITRDLVSVKSTFLVFQRELNGIIWMKLFWCLTQQVPKKRKLFYAFFYPPWNLALVKSAYWERKKDTVI